MQKPIEESSGSPLLAEGSQQIVLENQYLLNTDRESRKEGSAEKDGLEESEVKESFDISEFKKRVNQQVEAQLTQNQEGTVSEFQIPEIENEGNKDA